MTTVKTASRLMHSEVSTHTCDVVSLRRNRSRLYHSRGKASAIPRDYPLVDECGDQVGMIPAAATEPVLGQHAPTYYLLRKRAS
jgi:hypothetical protein